MSNVMLFGAYIADMSDKLTAFTSYIADMERRIKSDREELIDFINSSANRRLDELAKFKEAVHQFRGEEGSRPLTPEEFEQMLRKPNANDL